jgi:small-conductance mechanosensitive channel
MDASLQGAIFRSLAVIVVMIALHALAVRLVRSRTADLQERFRWRKIITYLTVFFGFLLVGRIWWEGVANIATFLGLITAGLAIAFRDPIVNFGGWLFILWRRPFVVGDRIQIGQVAGDVIDLRVFQIYLLEIGNWVEADQSTGRLIHVPNGLVFRDPVANYTRGLQFLWNELPVLITFESNWRKAKQILTTIVERHGAEAVAEAQERMRRIDRQYMIFYSTLTPTVYTAVKDRGVLLTIRYLCHPRRRRGSAQAIWEDVLAEFEKADDIAFAYPTTRFYDNATEGKPGTRLQP